MTKPSDRDIDATALLLIKQYGDDASFIAAQREDALRNLGDMDGVAAWARIYAAIQRMQRPPAGSAVH